MRSRPLWILNNVLEWPAHRGPIQEEYDHEEPFLKLTATASVTVLLAGFGAVAATSASASAAPAAVTHSAALPAGAPISAHPQHWWPDCDIDLLGPVLCLNL